MCGVTARGNAIVERFHRLLLNAVEQHMAVSFFVLRAVPVLRSCRTFLSLLKISMEVAFYKESWTKQAKRKETCHANALGSQTCA